MTEMAPEGGVEVLTIDVGMVDLTEIIGDLSLPCDYHPQFKCGPSAAQWVMLAVCGCGHIGHRLACDGCKDIWVDSEEMAAECRKCGEMFVPARKAFTSIEPI